MFAIVDEGGFLGMAERHHVVPWEAFSWTADERLMVPFDQGKLKGSPVFDRGNMPDWGNETWQRGIYDYYGIQYTNSMMAADDGGHDVRARGHDGEGRHGRHDGRPRLDRRRHGRRDVAGPASSATKRAVRPGRPRACRRNGPATPPRASPRTRRRTSPRRRSSRRTARRTPRRELLAALGAELGALGLGVALRADELPARLHVHVLAVDDPGVRRLLAHRVDLARRVRGLDLDLGRRRAREAQARLGVPAGVADVVRAPRAAVEVRLGLLDGLLELLVALHAERALGHALHRVGRAVEHPAEEARRPARATRRPGPHLYGTNSERNVSPQRSQ